MTAIASCLEPSDLTEVEVLLLAQEARIEKAGITPILENVSTTFESFGGEEKGQHI